MMEATTKTLPDRASWLKRRRTTRRALFGFTLLFAAFFGAALWLNEQNSQWWLQQFAQYQEDCSTRTADLSDCQVLTLQVHGYRIEGDEDDAEHHSWLVLENKTGRKFETESRQWFTIGTSVTALVYNDQVVEINDSGTRTQTAANPILRAQAAHENLAALQITALMWLCLVVPLTFIGADKLHEKQWRRAAGNNACK